MLVFMLTIQKLESQSEPVPAGEFPAGTVFCHRGKKTYVAKSPAESSEISIRATDENGETVSILKESRFAHSKEKFEEAQKQGVWLSGYIISIPFFVQFPNRVGLEPLKEWDY